MCVLVILSHPTLWDPKDYSPPGFSVRGILQARILKWVAISFSRGSSQPGDRTLSPALQADSLPSEPPRKLIKGIDVCIMKKKFNYLENEMSSIYL